MSAESDHGDWEELAALNALGLLEGAEAGRWNSHLELCEICRADEQHMQEIAGELAYATPAVAPRAGLRDRIMAQTGASSESKIIRAGDGEWSLTPFPGVEVRVLSTNPDTGDVTSMVRLAAGAVYASHRHGGSEHCYVLQGDLAFEDHTLLPGDYSVSAPGSIHTRSTSSQGCLLLIVSNVQDEILPTSGRPS